MPHAAEARDVEQLTNHSGSTVTNSLAIVGGLLAQASDNGTIAGLGLTAIFGALLKWGLDYYKEYNAGKRLAEKDAEKAARIEKLERTIDRSRKGWHDDRSLWSKKISVLEMALAEERAHSARLEGRLGITEEIHRNGINRNADKLREVAEVVGVDPEPVANIGPPDPVSSRFGESPLPFQESGSGSGDHATMGE